MKLFGCLKCFIFVFAVFATGASHADISSVGFVHAKILELKGIDLPIPAGVTADQVNSVHYMMTQIDAVNAQNGTVTHYADGPDATMNIMSADQVIADVTGLIVDAPCPENAFCVTLTGMAASSQFSFDISAAGNFTIDWGDGSAVQTLTRTNTTNTTYSHTYATAGNYRVTIDGLATSYSTATPTAAISFYPFNTIIAYRTKMTAIEGDLGKIFPVLNTSATGAPRFYQTFLGCIGLTEIPADLFASIQGAVVEYMFGYTFQGCTRLTGEIPADLFAGIVGPPARGMFDSTFRGCTGLTSIPSGLFAGISGAPAQYMFNNTFYNCTGLTGEIPSGLFGTLSGALARGMFNSTFYNCTGLTGAIPSGLFGNISGAPIELLFFATFYNCSGLTGEIPSGLFGTFTGAPAPNMFAFTFYGCTGLTSIADGIWDLSGLTNASASYIFASTFSGCTNITSASPNIAPGSSVKLWTKFTAYTGQDTFYNCTNMADFASIPAVWK